MDAKTGLVALFGVCSSLALAACGSGDEGAEEAAASAAPVAASAAPEATATAPATAEGEAAAVPLAEQDLAYGETGNTNLIGYLAVPGDLVGPLPGLIVIHGEDGLDEETRALTRRLAGERYITLAVDLYAGAGVERARDSATRAGVLLEQADATLANIRQAYDYLTKYASVPSVGAIGFSSGGSWALRAGIAMPNELDAVVTYYGEIITETLALSQMTAPVLGHFPGAEESLAADARIFRNRLREEDKRAEIYVYPSAAPGFANPASPTYSAESADEAWQRTVEFLGINLARE